MIVDRDRPASGVLQQRDVEQNRTRTRTRTRTRAGSAVGESAIGARRWRRGRVGEPGAAPPPPLPHPPPALLVAFGGLVSQGRTPVSGGARCSVKTTPVFLRTCFPAPPAWYCLVRTGYPSTTPHMEVTA